MTVFGDRLTRWLNDFKLRRLRRRCYQAIDKIRDGNQQLNELNREIREMTQQ